MKSISPFYFLVSLAIGMFLVYITTPPPEVIIEYPTPDNAGKVIYKDSSNSVRDGEDGCYTYMAKQVSCPTNEEDIMKTPFQSYNNEKKNSDHPFKNIYNILGGSDSGN
jgi:hypothetical protein